MSSGENILPKMEIRGDAEGFRIQVSGFRFQDSGFRRFQDSEGFRFLGLIGEFLN